MSFFEDIAFTVIPEFFILPFPARAAGFASGELLTANCQLL